jgi:hypothetical protein
LHHTPSEPNKGQPNGKGGNLCACSKIVLTF